MHRTVTTTTTTTTSMASCCRSWAIRQFTRAAKRATQRAAAAAAVPTPPPPPPPPLLPPQKRRLWVSSSSASCATQSQPAHHQQPQLLLLRGAAAWSRPRALLSNHFEDPVRRLGPLPTATTTTTTTSAATWKFHPLWSPPCGCWLSLLYDHDDYDDDHDKIMDVEQHHRRQGRLGLAPSGHFVRTNPRDFRSFYSSSSFSSSSLQLQQQQPFQRQWYTTTSVVSARQRKGRGGGGGGGGVQAGERNRRGDSSPNETSRRRRNTKKGEEEEEEEENDAQYEQDNDDHHDKMVEYEDERNMMMKEKELWKFDDEELEDYELDQNNNDEEDEDEDDEQEEDDEQDDDEEEDEDDEQEEMAVFTDQDGNEFESPTLQNLLAQVRSPNQHQDNIPPMVKVAIMGPPNAGKSTLYNRLLDKTVNKTYRLASQKIRRPTTTKTSGSSSGKTGKGQGSQPKTKKRGRRSLLKKDGGRFSVHPTLRKQYTAGTAIVSDVPGTTRDRRQGVGRIGGVYFQLMDTAGIDGERLDYFHQVKRETMRPTSSAEQHWFLNKRVDKHKKALDFVSNMTASLPKWQRERAYDSHLHGWDFHRHRNPTNTISTKNNAALTPREILRPMVQQALKAAQEAHLILFLFDARIGVTSDFYDTCQWLRRTSSSPSSSSSSSSTNNNNNNKKSKKQQRHSKGKNKNNSDNDHNNSNNDDDDDKNNMNAKNILYKSPNRRRIVLLANKLEGDAWNYEGSDIMENMYEATRAGFGEPLPISALHGDGMADLAVLIHQVQQDLLREYYSEKKKRTLHHQEPPQLALPPDDTNDDETAKPKTRTKKGKGDRDSFHAEFGLDDDDEEEEEEEEGGEYDPHKWSWPFVEEELLHGPTLEQLMNRHGNDKLLQLAILGRVNVGKSSIVNALLREDRMITGPMPGLTRDSIAIEWSYKGRPVQLVDTAGLRKPSKRTDDAIEEMAVMDAMRAMKVANVAVLVLDAGARMLQRHELAICDTVLKEGRALIVAANKMDLICDLEYTARDFEKGVRQQLEGRFPMLRHTPIVPMSTVTGEGVDRLMPAVFDARDRWSQTIPTGRLNKWLREVVEEHAPPLHEGRPMRIKYMVQTKGRPPTFLLFCNTTFLPEAYLRYLTRQFQESFDYYGMNVRLIVKPSSLTNPFAASATKRKGFGLGGRKQQFKRKYARYKATGSAKPMRKRKRRVHPARYY